MTAQVLELKPGDAVPDLPYAAEVAPLTDLERGLHAPDRHFLSIDALGTVTARGSCWWTKVPRLDGDRIGIIGHYAAGSLDGATALLAHACARLASAGCARAVGPMDGNTWRSYRLVTDRGAAPQFFLEPWTPQAWLQQWRAAGFAPLAEYTSAANDDLSQEDPRIPAAEARLIGAGVTIRSLDAADPDRDLYRIFALAVESFGRNYLFAPLSETEFLDQNRQLLPFVIPDLVLIAEHDGEACGFLFALPDVLQARRSAPVDTVIVKTVAVRPDARYAGLGSVLVARVHRSARELGFRRAIHALMHEGNVSRNISRRFAKPIRRYALFGKTLTASGPPEARSGGRR